MLVLCGQFQMATAIKPDGDYVLARTIYSAVCKL